MKDHKELFTGLMYEAKNKLKILSEDTLTLQYKSGKDLRREKRKLSRKQNKQ